jgi:peptidoglycan/LPS O-acetylase OafA/YrhL
MDTRENANLDFLRSFAVLRVVFGHVTHFFAIDRRFGSINRSGCSWCTNVFRAYRAGLDVIPRA